MASEKQTPRALQPGDTIGLVAPAGVVDRERLNRAVGILQDCGFRTKTYRDLFARDGFLAGNDQIRVAELHAAFADPEVAAVFPARGGYGCLRLLPHLDLQLIRNHPKLFVGFSDNTVLHAAFARHADLVTFHGPHPSDSLGRPDGPTPLTAEWYWRFLQGEADAYPLHLPLPDAVALREGEAQGKIVGGNLALIGALMGTAFEPEFDGNLLLIEDIGEPAYRVDRLLTQLLVAGKLQRVAGVLVGDFLWDGATPEPHGVTIRHVLEERLGQLSCPVLLGIKSGHGEDNLTLPFGSSVLLDASAGSLTFLERPTQSP